MSAARSILMEKAANAQRAIRCPRLGVPELALELMAKARGAEPRPRTQDSRISGIPVMRAIPFHSGVFQQLRQLLTGLASGA